LANQPQKQREWNESKESETKKWEVQPSPVAF
jgi:hypothetical protein